MEFCRVLYKYLNFRGEPGEISQHYLFYLKKRELSSPLCTGQKSLSLARSQLLSSVTKQSSFSSTTEDEKVLLGNSHTSFTDSDTVMPNVFRVYMKQNQTGLRLKVPFQIL